mgnify:CR=1 FL=1
MERPEKPDRLPTVLSKQEVLKMRKKMRDAHPPRPGLFDLKPMTTVLHAAEDTLAAVRDGEQFLTQLYSKFIDYSTFSRFRMKSYDDLFDREQALRILRA